MLKWKANVTYTRITNALSILSQDVLPAFLTYAGGVMKGTDAQTKKLFAETLKDILVVKAPYPKDGSELHNMETYTLECSQFGYVLLT